MTAAVDLPKADADTTRQRILDAAELVFAEKGRDGASVRDILHQAGVKNIAAINYHFGDKDRLYIAVVKQAHQVCNSIPFPEWAPGTSPVQKLRDIIAVLARRMTQPQRPTALQLMMREMAQPTEACEEVVREYIRPMAQVLEQTLAEICPDVPRPKRFLIGNSIVGQCLFYRQNRAVLERLMGPLLDQITAEVLADHVTEFTLAALGLVTEEPASTSH